MLRSGDETRSIAIRPPSGEELQEHRVHERAFLLDADGEIEMAQDGNSVNGGTGFLSHFEPNERRTVCALRRRAAGARARPWSWAAHAGG
jgi:hypothetical protein